MENTQSGILANETPLARYMVFSLEPGADAGVGVRALNQCVDGDAVVVGLGTELVKALGASVDGMQDFPVHTGPGFAVPSTPAALWFWLRGDDRGELVHQSRRLEIALAGIFCLDEVIDAFQYRDTRDLTGYVDGTENPTGGDAVEVALVRSSLEGMDGSSFVAVQQWVHDLDAFQCMPQDQQDNTIGRRVSDNEEIEDAPDSAHVKRTAQEDFEPEAFVLRRSMPWANEHQAGLVFVAFGHSFDAFEALLNRMVGKDDGIVDALFSFTRPVTGGYYWCPPMRDGRLDLRAVGID